MESFEWQVRSSLEGMKVGEECFGGRPQETAQGEGPHIWGTAVSSPPDFPLLNVVGFAKWCILPHPLLSQGSEDPELAGAAHGAQLCPACSKASFDQSPCQQGGRVACLGCRRLQGTDRALRQETHQLPGTQSRHHSCQPSEHTRGCPG